MKNIESTASAGNTTLGKNIITIKAVEKTAR